MSSVVELLIYNCVRVIAVIVRCLPFSWAMRLGRCAGWLGCIIASKKRRFVFLNLKTAFAAQKSVKEIKRLTYEVFKNYAQSIIEVLCLPKIRRAGFDRYVTLQGREHLQAALQQGKGVILLAMHSGSWELASLVGSMLDHPYNIVANAQPKMPLLDDLLNHYRSCAGAKVIMTKTATRDILRALYNNEIVALVADQGGKEGRPYKFFGKMASFSTGAVRLGLKHQVPVCPVWIHRKGVNRHVLEVFAPLPCVNTGGALLDVDTHMQQAVTQFEARINSGPAEYMWFYKVWKYSTDKKAIILDDGRTGHLRQSQAMARALSTAFQEKQTDLETKVVKVNYRNTPTAALAAIFSALVQWVPFLRSIDILRWCLTSGAYKAVHALKADYVISCGAKMAPVNYFLSRANAAKSIAVLRPGLLHHSNFDLVVLPMHDVKGHTAAQASVVVTKVAPNLVDTKYMKENADFLLGHFSHLKGRVKPRIGVLLGGTTKGVSFSEAKIRHLLQGIKQAAVEFNCDILLSTSRRTPATIEAMVSRELKKFDHCPLCLIANEDNMPQAVGGILGLADILVVSAESISMVSEAVSSDKITIAFPVWDSQQGNNKYADFCASLELQGHLVVAPAAEVGKAIANVFKKKIYTKPLQDVAVIHRAVQRCV